MYEWLHGPCLHAELVAQEALFPSAEAVRFGPEEAAIAAGLCAQLRTARGRELDLAIVAQALAREAMLGTVNVGDFADLSGLALSRES